MAEQKRNWLVQAGDRMSDAVARWFAHPVMHILVILFCAAWFLVGLPTDLLTAALSILAITLAQMVLNGQFDREADAHRRDVAMHAKLDELIKATKRARNEMVGIEEELDEEGALLGCRGGGAGGGEGCGRSGGVGGGGRGGGGGNGHGGWMRSW